jgi:NAD-dependent SIR2 family protein deacetylase
MLILLFIWTSHSVAPDNGWLLFLQWAQAIDSLEVGQPGSDKSFGMQQRPDGDVEIDEKFWEQDFEIPSCHQCGGVLKPDVRFRSSWCF